jgi:hypothetical protein
MTHLRELQEAGLTTVHLLPRSTSPPSRRTARRRSSRSSPTRARLDRAAGGVMAVADEDGFNWGYDPFHFNAPEGSYATDPQGTTRIVEFREMVQSLNETDLGWSWTWSTTTPPQSGQDDKSVLDKVVPGYYHRLLGGRVHRDEHVLPEHRDRARHDGEAHGRLRRAVGADYKVDGFRFDLMGHHSKANMLAVRRRSTRSPSRPTASTARASTSTARAGTSARSPTTPASSRPRRPTWPAPASARSTTGCATPCVAAGRSTRTRGQGFGSGLCHRPQRRRDQR